MGVQFQRPALHTLRNSWSASRLASTVVSMAITPRATVSANGACSATRFPSSVTTTPPRTRNWNWRNRYLLEHLAHDGVTQPAGFPLCADTDRVPRGGMR